MKTLARLRLFRFAPLLVASVAFPTLAVAEPELLMHLKLDESPAAAGRVMSDASGNANHAIVVNNNWDVDKSVPGVHGNALRFDGDGDRLDGVPFDIDDTFTIALWVNPATTANRQAFLGKHDSNGGNQFVLGFFSGYHVRIRGVTYQAGTPRTGWQHIAVVGEATGANSTEVTLYRNAIPLWTQTLSARIGDVAGGLGWTFGQEWDAGPVTSDYLNGDLDDVKIWNGALTAEEIETEFRGGIITPPHGPGASPKLDFMVHEATLTEQLGAELEGHQIGVYGDTLVLGAPFESVHAGDGEPGASVFERADGEWNFVKLLNFGDGTDNDTGHTVAIYEDTIAVGSPFTRRVLIATRIDGEWVEQARLSAADELFGDALALHGDTLVVGSRSVGGNLASATVYVRSEGAWTQQARLLTPARNREEGIALHEDTLVIMDNTNDFGAAFVFERDGATWTQVRRLTAPDTPAGNMFRRSVSIHGDAIAVGELRNRGRIYLYRRQGETWVFETKIMPPDTDAGWEFGRHVVLHEDALFTGSPEDGVEISQGAAYLYGRDNGEWSLIEEFENRHSFSGGRDRLGGHIAFDGTTAVAVTDGYWGPLPQGVQSVHIFRVTSTAKVPQIRALLYRSDAMTFPDGDPGAAAFRYREQLYQEDADGIRPLHEEMPGFYDEAERLRALEAESLLRHSIALFPEDPELEQLLLDIHYDRTVAEAILLSELRKGTERARFGPPLANPPPANGFIIDNEILLFRDLIADSKSAMAGYFALLSDDLGSPGDPPYGYTLFRDLVPERGLMAATYDDGEGGAVPVTGEAMLFSGYKDLVLIFELLRDHGRAAHDLARLLVARNAPGDRDEAKTFIAESERLLYLQGSLLQSIFPELPGPEDPSGLVQAIAGWSGALESLANLRQIIASEANLLGFAPDFLMLIENFTGPGSDFFDSFDVFRERLSLNTLDSSLRRARDRLQTARDTYDQFRGYEGQILEQFEQSTISYESRLFEIVGARPGEPNYSDVANTNPGSELDQQFRSINLAQLKIDRNKAEIDNLAEEVQIEINRAVDVSAVYIDYGDRQASVTETIGAIKAGQAAANALAGVFSPEKLLKRAVVAGVLNAAAQAGGEAGIAHLEASKERLAAAEQSRIEGINSSARVKTLLLGMNTLVVDSAEARLLMQQEVARLAALYREISELESRIAERNSGLAARYFADPVHRLAADWRMIEANLGFEEAQRWLFFMVRALEFKWNTPFAGFAHDGRTWSVSTLFKLRNADELEAFFNAMNAFDALINRGKTYRFDWFSVREDFMGLKMLDDEGQTAEYIDPVTGETHDAIGMFRAILARSVRPVQGGQEIVIEFNTVRQIPGGFFFVGPTFNLDGTVASPGRFLNKIDYLQIRLPGDHTLGRSQLAGRLTYGGTSFIRNFNVGQFDPERSDRLVNEMTSYSTRYWFFDPTPGQQRWKFTEGLTIDAVEMQLSDDPRQPPTVGKIHEFKERSVAATGWRLVIPLVQQNTQVLKLDELNDIEIYFHHYSAQRQ